MELENKHNYYEILELTENATEQEIYAAYLKAKMTYSVENKDLYSVFTVDEARELRSLIEEAYEVLSNSMYRNIYEKRLLANTFSESDLTAQSIKSASEDFFKNEQNFQIKNITFDTANVVDLNFESEIAEKKEWNGQDLKKVREHRHLSFDELTDITKINPWYIAALEEMDPAGLPVEVFVRGYVIHIAKALGLKEKIVADSYMRLFRKKIEN